MTKTPADDPIAAFQAENRARVAEYAENPALSAAARTWREQAFRQKYMYHFAWTDRPIIQMPADIVATQEAIWSFRPDLIIETGIAHGGSLMLSASMLALLDMEDAQRAGEVLDPARPKRRVLGVDIDVRAHNRAAIEGHFLSPRIDMIEGPSLDEGVVDQVRDAAKGYERVMVMLDSNHTHEHVLGELEAYAPLVTAGGWCLVFDTVIEHLPADMFPDRPWAPGDNAATAVASYLELLAGEGRVAADGAPLHLELDAHLDNKLMVSVAPAGWLKRV